MDLGPVSISIWIISFALECWLAVLIWHGEARYGKLAVYVGFCIVRDVVLACFLWSYPVYYYFYWFAQGLSIFLLALMVREVMLCWGWRGWYGWRELRIPEIDPWRQILLGLMIEAGSEVATFGAKLALHLHRNSTLVHIRGVFFVAMLALWIDALAGKGKR